MNNPLTYIKKYLSGSISSDEKQALQNWVEESEENRKEFIAAVKRWNANQPTIDVDSQKVYAKLMDKMVPVRKLHPVYRFSRYAAIFIGVAAMVYFFNKKEDSSTNAIEVVTNPTEDHNADKVKITLADGTVSYLDVDGSSDIKDANGNVVGTKSDRNVQFQANESETLVYNEIVIPRGEMFQLTLSDGTQVWLNADSSLKFPQKFINNAPNRMVYLEGEAFFDVTTNKEKPFVVKVDQMDVQVLGTQFNVSSYADDPAVATTLVEGSVLVQETEVRENSIILTPSYQATFDRSDKKMKQQKVNTDLYTAWRSKKIVLHNEPFSKLAKRIERAYDVDIVNHYEALNNAKFTGEFDVENIEDILMTFAEILPFTYEINDKNITITP